MIKKLKIGFILLCSFLLPTLLVSQKEFDFYDNPIFGSKRISLGQGTDGGFSLCIEGIDLEGQESEGGFMVNDKMYDSFIMNLKKAKAKYAEWDNVAKLKEKSNNYNFNFNFNLSYFFRVSMLEGKAVRQLIIKGTEELKSSNNEFITHIGFALIFLTPQDFSIFINKISKDKIEAFLNKPKVEDLFKD